MGTCPGRKFGANQRERGLVKMTPVAVSRVESIPSSVFAASFPGIRSGSSGFSHSTEAAYNGLLSIELEFRRIGAEIVSLGTAYPHIEKPAGGPARLERMPRLRVAQVAMDYLAHGWSADEMCRQHDGLTKAEAHAAMTYYFDHQAEIDAEITAEVSAADAALKQSSESPLRVGLRAKGLL